jgi:uracil phosphoribosyltransferase
MDGVTIVDHPLVQHKLTLLRDKTRSTKVFRELFNEIGALLCYEVTRDLPLANVEVETPLAKMQSPKLAGKKLVLAPVGRAGSGFLEGMLNLLPSARVAHIGIYRDPRTLTSVEYFFKAPDDMPERLALVLHPMLATGNSAVAASIGSRKPERRLSASHACWRRDKRSKRCAQITRTFISGPRPSTTPSMRLATFCPVSAMLEIGCLGRVSRRHFN